MTQPEVRNPQSSEDRSSNVSAERVEVPNQPSIPRNPATTSHNVPTVDNTSQVNEEPEFVPWRSGDPFRYPIPKDGNPWETCYKAVKNYDDAMCTAWKDEVQNLLIFAGLFSAVVTAFIVESYKMLTDPIDNSTRLLTQIAVELASINGRNATTTILPQENFSPSAIAVRLNTVWFLSLTLSLATALVGILALQWIREYERYGTTSYKERLDIRQRRYEGIMKWQVPNILRGLPILLQSALILFFLGMLDLLQSLDYITMIILTIVVGLVFLVIVTTTVIPGIQLIFVQRPFKGFVDSQSWSFCPYKSPQSWAFYQLVFQLASISYKLKLLSCWPIRQFNMSTRNLSSGGCSGTYKYLPNAIAWAGRTFRQGNDSLLSAIYYCVNDMPSSLTARRTVVLLDGFGVEIGDPTGDVALYNDITSARCLRYFSGLSHTPNQQLSVHEMELFVRIYNNETQNTDDGFSCPFISFDGHTEDAKDITKFPSGKFVWYGIVDSDTINSALHIPLAKLYGILYQWICRPQLEPTNCNKSSGSDPRYSLFERIMVYISLKSPQARVHPNLDGYSRSQQHREMLKALEDLFRAIFSKYSKQYFAEYPWRADSWSAFRDKTLLVTLPGVKDMVMDN
ncbi:hypothetical protein BDQ12DRAFT_708156 [Crucibulum laeve]|uniref:DUF6535 domain-containing protein n=1 Tax=Crucibulum laeve TaxID=68775 RepID=A0A5C3MS38_9AGAR|nr:hypothetical protein BDQ12DRAFT_708156 [Crucibulum laeve]